MLSRVIPAHTNDVKCVFATSVGSIISGSRDGTVKIFSERAGDYMESLLIRQSNKLAVNSVTFYQNSSGWYIFAGRMDGSIAIFSSGRAEPIRVLNQHSNNGEFIFNFSLS
ncbi:unnamed protein product [Anisakis simplex]|uniref:Phospholipase A-2-activating protein (inferred by orthology to a human protein) n=1 Tax=Anisakis simplex TaxID=6269 RepID=A0A0M3J8C2_ANISI|nr:unnamed protein product [Anisakis simplex]